MDPIEQPTGNQPTDRRKSSFGDAAIWTRGLYMLLLLLAFSVAHALLCVTAIAQFLWLLFNGEANNQLAQFGNSLSRWFGDTARYLTCVSEVRPFPWAPWPPAV